MASEMLVKFEKYWSDYSIVLSIAIVLDPRYKTFMIRNALSILYVNDEVERRMQAIRDDLLEMYKFYDTSPSSSTSTPAAMTSSSDAFEVGSLFEVRILFI